MAAYRVLGKLITRKFDQRIIITPSIRTYWNKDWCPGPRPVTAEEHAAAAKKYGLIPEDYQAFPESKDGINYGDYPKLKDVSAECRDPYEAYDFPEFRRNYGEPLNVNFDIYGEDRVNISARPKNSFSKKLRVFLSVWLGLFALYCVGEYFKYERPLMPKQFPYSGETHYVFPKNENEQH